LQIADFRLQIRVRTINLKLQSAICNLQSAICNPDGITLHSFDEQLSHEAHEDTKTERDRRLA
jgi:hypothetical protein